MRRSAMIISYYLKTRADSIIEFRREDGGDGHFRWSLWYDQEGRGEVNEKLQVDVWIVNAVEKGIVARPDGYYETETARLMWNHLVQNNHMVRYTELENVK